MTRAPGPFLRYAWAWVRMWLIVGRLRLSPDLDEAFGDEQEECGAMEHDERSHDMVIECTHPWWRLFLPTYRLRCTWCGHREPLQRAIVDDDLR